MQYEFYKRHPIYNHEFRTSVTGKKEASENQTCNAENQKKCQNYQAQKNFPNQMSYVQCQWLIV